MTIAELEGLPTKRIAWAVADSIRQMEYMRPWWKGCPKMGTGQMGSGVLLVLAAIYGAKNLDQSEGKNPPRNHILEAYKKGGQKTMSRLGALERGITLNSG